MIVSTRGMGGCQCGGNCGPCKAGMGQFDLSWFTGSVNLFGFDVPMWALVGGGVIIAWWLLFPSGSEYRRKRAALRSQYRGVSRAKRAAARARRAAEGFVL